MIKLGLTGSIGMGKSTTARMFADQGVPVWDADAAVHELYGPDAAGTREIAALVPEAAGPEGVDRAILRDAIQSRPGLLQQIEAVIHPLVGAHRSRFLEDHAGAPVVLCDIPLLFETGADRWLDRIVVVSAPPEVQRERVLARPGMTAEVFKTILAKQLPDAEKRARADFIIDSSRGLEPARAQVRQILEEIHA